jgi:hypothetical protein
VSGRAALREGSRPHDRRSAARGRQTGRRRRCSHGLPALQGGRSEA